MRALRPGVEVSARWVAAVILAGTACLGTPHAAMATTTGGGTFDATAKLDTFPCPSGGCFGSITGVAAGLSLSGVGTSSISGVPLPYAAQWVPTQAVLDGGFTYQDVCELGQPDGTVPLSTSGTGSFTLTGGVAVIAGAPTTATLSGTIFITRVGDAIRVVLASLAITPPSGSPVLAVNLTDAVGGESPTGIVWTNGPGTCGNPTTHQVLNQTADIVGVALQPL